jgi:regulatory protein
MIITRLEDKGKSEVKIYLDEEYAFSLSKKEAELYDLAEGKEMTAQIQEAILADIVFPRAKQKALGILKFMDRSEQELRRKLADSGFPMEITDKAISYVSEYGYLNDERFASNYIRLRKNTKSKMVISAELIQKGIKKETIHKILANEYDNEEQEDAELIAIRKAVAKKTNSPGTLSPEEKQKLMASLYRKGFDIGKIKQILSD